MPITLKWKNPGLGHLPALGFEETSITILIYFKIGIANSNAFKVQGDKEISHKVAVYEALGCGGACTKSECKCSLKSFFKNNTVLAKQNMTVGYHPVYHW